MYYLLSVPARHLYYILSHVSRVSIVGSDSPPPPSYTGSLILLYYCDYILMPVVGAGVSYSYVWRRRQILSDLDVYSRNIILKLLTYTTFKDKTTYLTISSFFSSNFPPPFFLSRLMYFYNASRVYYNTLLYDIIIFFIIYNP